MRHLHLTENAPSQPFNLSSEEAEALAGAELAVVSRVPGSGSWDVAAGSKVGVVRVGDLQVTVCPKIPIDRLVFMMGYAQKPQFWRDHSVLLDSHSDLADALAESFRRLATMALEQGLLHGYRSVDEALPVLGGLFAMRIRFRGASVSGFHLRSATTSSPSTSLRTSCCWQPPSAYSGCQALRSLSVVHFSGCVFSSLMSPQVCAASCVRSGSLPA